MLVLSHGTHPRPQLAHLLPARRSQLCGNRVPRRPQLADGLSMVSILVLVDGRILVRRIWDCGGAVWRHFDDLCFAGFPCAAEEKKDAYEDGDDGDEAA